MTGFDLSLWSVLGFVLQHALLFGLPLGVVAIVLAVVFLGAGPALLAFLRSSVGHLIIACLVTAGLVWEARGWVDGAAQIRANVAAERLKTQAAELAAAKARLQAEALATTVADANARESAARANAQDLQDQADDFANQLADAAEAQPADAGRPCRLTNADALRLRGIGPGAARKRP